MAQKDVRYRIVVGVDFSPIGENALEQAIDLASRRDGAEIHAVHVIDDVGGRWPHLSEEARLVRARDTQVRLQHDLTAKLLQPGRSAALLDGHHPHVVHLRVGAPALQIVGVANDIEAALIVVGTHGHRGLQRLLLGSVAERVVRLADCPVLVIRPPEETERVEEPEPACPDCIEVRAVSSNRQWWCARHEQHHLRRHTYSYSSPLNTPSRFLTFGA